RAIDLLARPLIAIESADQTNAERDVVQVIAVNVAAVDLPPPPVAHFNLPIAGGSPIPDDEMISEPVLHPANAPVVVIECGRVPLTRSAVVHNNILPATSRDWRALDLSTDRPRVVSVTGG